MKSTTWTLYTYNLDANGKVVATKVEKRTSLNKRPMPATSITFTFLILKPGSSLSSINIKWSVKLDHIDPWIFQDRTYQDQLIFRIAIPEYFPAERNTLVRR